MTIRTVAHALPCIAPARADERWREGLGARRPPAIVIAFVAVSLVLHAALLSFALFAAKAEAASPPQETPVEVVQEVPPKVPKPTPPAAPPAPEASKPPEPKAPAPVAEKPAAPEPKAVAEKPAPPPPSAAETQRADLEHQLDELKAEQQALKAENSDLGPLRDSIHAVALPSEGRDGDGEVVGYQSLVFSQLAKAKDGAREAAKPATVGVRFTVDDAGGLVEVAIAVSSGVADLDAESLAIVRHAAPFPKPPAGAEHIFSANFAYAGAQR